MAPETFKQIVDNQQAALITGPGEPLAMGTTREGEQIAVLQGKREEDEVGQFVVVTAPNTDRGDSQFATEVIPVGSLAVHHPSVDMGVRSGWYIQLGDKRHIAFPSERAKAEGALVRIGSAAIHPVVDTPARPHHRRIHRRRAEAV